MFLKIYSNLVYKDLSRNEYQDIYDFVDKLRASMEFDLEVKVKVEKNEVLTGRAFPGVIVISNSLLNTYSFNPNILRFEIAHELVHMKYQDPGPKTVLRSICRTKCNVAKLLIQEVRADVEGKKYAEITDDEIKKVHLYHKEEGKEQENNDKKYRSGYPFREQRADLSVRYSDITEELINEVIIDYCSVRNYKKKELLIKEIKKLFIKERNTGTFR